MSVAFTVTKRSGNVLSGDLRAMFTQPPSALRQHSPTSL